MRDLVRQHRRLFLLLTLAGVALRLFFIFKFPVTEGDTLIYGDIAKNWLAHGIFGQTINGEPEPTLIRLPGFCCDRIMAWCWWCCVDTWCGSGVGNRASCVTRSLRF